MYRAYRIGLYTMDTPEQGQREVPREINSYEAEAKVKNLAVCVNFLPYSPSPYINDAH